MAKIGTELEIKVREKKEMVESCEGCGHFCSARRRCFYNDTWKNLPESGFPEWCPLPDYAPQNELFALSED